MYIWFFCMYVCLSMLLHIYLFSLSWLQVCLNKFSSVQFPPLNYILSIELLHSGATLVALRLSTRTPSTSFEVGNFDLGFGVSSDESDEDTSGELFI